MLEGSGRTCHSRESGRPCIAEVVDGDLLEAALDVEHMAHRVHADHHELALPIEGVLQVVEGVHVGVAEHRGCGREGKGGARVRG